MLLSKVTLISRENLQIQIQKEEVDELRYHIQSIRGSITLLKCFAFVDDPLKKVDRRQLNLQRKFLLLSPGANNCSSTSSWCAT